MLSLLLEPSLISIAASTKSALTSSIARKRYLPVRTLLTLNISACFNVSRNGGKNEYVSALSSYS